MIEQKEVEDLIRPVLYRAEADVFECRHLQRSPILQPTEVLRVVESAKVSRLLAPHEMSLGSAMPELRSVSMWPGLPPAGLTCDHAKNVEWARGMMPPEVRSSVTMIQTTVDFCRTCPLFERRLEE
jgi:hypothetical protein